MRYGGFLLAGLCLTIASAGSRAGDVAYAVAERTRDARPPQAPTVREFSPTPAWREKALQGIVSRGTENVRFLNEQGAWYTPFAAPGMPGPYDLRDFHAKHPRPGSRASR